MLTAFQELATYLRMWRLQPHNSPIAQRKPGIDATGFDKVPEAPEQQTTYISARCFSPHGYNSCPSLYLQIAVGREGPEILTKTR